MMPDSEIVYPIQYWIFTFLSVVMACLTEKRTTGASIIYSDYVSPGAVFVDKHD